MNRIGICTALNTDEDVACVAGELLLVSSTGENVALGATGPFAPPTTVDILVGLPDGSSKELITINPKAFSYSVLKYVAAVAKTVVVGKEAATGGIVILDPSVATNVTKVGSIRLSKMDIKSAVLPNWGDVFEETIQIANGDTTATLLAKLGVKAAKIVADINAKYGAGTVTLTNDLANGSSYFHLTFVFEKTKPFNVTVDGIFDGTTITVTGGDPCVSGLTGAEVKAKEMEALVMDGYNPTQVAHYQTFDVANVLAAATGTNYDCIMITTTLPKEYETPASPTGWDVTAEIYSPTGSNVTGANTNAITAILDEMIANNQGLTKAMADATYLTETAADLLYAAHA